MEPVGRSQPNGLFYFTIMCQAIENHSRPAIGSWRPPLCRDAAWRVRKKNID